MPDDTALLSVLESLRARGALGEASLPDAIRHAELFLTPIPPSARRLLDLGSGGGLPGLVLACRLPALDVVLADRRERRVDLLRLAISRLGLDRRVSAVTADVVELATDPAWRGGFDVVTARAFGAPLWTLRCAVPFLGPDGVIIVSEPPVTDSARRWPADDVAALGLQIASHDAAAVRAFSHHR